MPILTEDMIRVVREQRLGFVATVREDGRPNLSPKGTTTFWRDDCLIFADLCSPGTVRNLLGNPAIEINVVDVFSRRGYRFSGRAEVLTDGPLFADARRFYAETEGLGDEVANIIRAIVLMRVFEARPLVSPAYALGQTEAQLRASWQQHYVALAERSRFP